MGCGVRVYGEQTYELVAVACREKQEVPMLKHVDGLHEEAMCREKEGQLERGSEQNRTGKEGHARKWAAGLLFGLARLLGFDNWA